MKFFLWTKPWKEKKQNKKKNKEQKQQQTDLGNQYCLRFHSLI